MSLDNIIRVGYDIDGVFADFTKAFTEAAPNINPTSDENITDSNIQRLSQQLVSLNNPTRDDLYKTCRGFLTTYLEEEQTINAVSTKTAKFIQRNTEKD